MWVIMNDTVVNKGTHKVNFQLFFSLIMLLMTVINITCKRKITFVINIIHSRKNIWGVIKSHEILWDFVVNVIHSMLLWTSLTTFLMIWTTFINKINGLISFEAKLISYSFAKNHVYWYFADERKLVGGWRRERRYLCSALIRKLRKSKINALFFGFSVRLR